jgi:DNA modification methylase
LKEYINKLFNIDNLELMNKLPDSSVDLIYCDVLYGTGRDFGDYKDISSNKQVIYNFYQPRIKEMYRILKETGSIYLQCDWKINHHLREIMDDIFGVEYFRNVIVWQRSNGKNNSTKNFENATDTIIFYTKSDNYTFNVIKKDLKDSSIKRYNKVTQDGRRYMVANLMDKQSYKGKPDVRHINGKEYVSKDKLGYKWSQAKIDEELKNGTEFVENSEGNLAVIKYLENSNGANVDNIWNDIYCIVSTDTYATQKPKELISRIIQASSNEGDLVADFFCGSGTTCVVAKELRRNYIGCDIGEKAIHIATNRILVS